MHRLLPLTIGLSLGVLAAPIFAQSLGDVAKKEKERRKQIEKPAEVIDDETLSDASYDTPLMESSVTTGTTRSLTSAPTPAASNDAADGDAPRKAPAPDYALELQMCRTKVIGLKGEQRRARSIMANGYVVRETSPRVNRSTDNNNRVMGWHYQTRNTMSCFQAEQDPLRHKKVLDNCKRLEKRLAELDGEIASKTAECEELERKVDEK